MQALQLSDWTLLPLSHQHEHQASLAIAQLLPSHAPVNTAHTCRCICHQVRQNFFRNWHLVNAAKRCSKHSSNQKYQVLSCNSCGRRLLSDDWCQQGEADKWCCPADIASGCKHLGTFQQMLNVVQVHAMYNWPRIAARTEVVYKAAVVSQRDDSLMGRFCRYYLCGSWFGKICCCVAAVMHLYWRWIEMMCPRKNIDIAPTFPRLMQTCKLD